MNVGSFDTSKYSESKTIDDAFGRASSTDQSQAKILTVSGTYVMEVATFCFRNNKKKDRPVIISPTLADSSKGGINLIASLKVVDGTDRVGVGDYITINVPVRPGPNASIEDAEKMFKLSKPRMCALLGDDNFNASLKNIVDKFSTEWKEVDGKFVLVKDHALKSKVVCVFEDGVYNDKAKLELVSLRKFKEGDKSISNSPLSEAPQTGFGSAAVPVGEEKDMDFEAAGQMAPGNAGQPDITTVDDMPFQ
jgi:hypothetical protein